MIEMYHAKKSAMGTYVPIPQTTRCRPELSLYVCHENPNPRISIMSQLFGFIDFGLMSKLSSLLRRRREKFWDFYNQERGKSLISSCF